ncbi:hypothetical protein ACO0LC_19600 [Undibacterium sp. JH2W]|uniref:hypothetical protein n=1 Tax=Undibacterium sp. JH2W TaxID=3413037 RepID=UPI003BF2B25B
MKKRKLITALLFAYMLISLLANSLIGSRPPLPFFPYGAAMLAVVATGIIAAYLAYAIKTRQTAFLRLFNFCCVLVALYLLVQIYMYIKLGDNIYWIRTAVNLSSIFLGWYLVFNAYKLQKILLQESNPRRSD